MQTEKKVPAFQLPESPAAPAASAPEKPVAPAAAPAAPAPEAAAKTSGYTVAAGDNLTSIAKKFNTTVSALLAANSQIKNPNLIYAGAQLTMPSGTSVTPTPFTIPSGYEAINGALYNTTALQTANYTDIKTTPDGLTLYGKKTSIADSVNSEAKASMDITNSVRVAAGEDKRYTEQEKDLQKRIDELTAGEKKDVTAADSSVTASDGSVISLTDDKTALELYKELMQTPDILAASKAMGAKQEELDKLNADEAAFASDILKEVQGDAPQSYIDALVAERSKDLYPKKLALTAELNNLSAQYTSLKENAANVLQYTLADQTTRYNRMFQNLQLTQSQSNWQKTFDATQTQQARQQEIQILGVLKDLPATRSVTIGGTVYKGMSEDANLNVIQFTDASHNVVVVAVDKQTGEIKYKKIVGTAPAPAGSTGASREITFVDKDGVTWLKGYDKNGAEVYSTRVGEGQKGVVTADEQLKQDRATAQAEIDKKVASGSYVEITDDKGSYVIDAVKYNAALQSWSQEGAGIIDKTTITFKSSNYEGKKSTAPNPLDFKVYSPK